MHTRLLHSRLLHTGMQRKPHAFFRVDRADAASRVEELPGGAGVRAGADAEGPPEMVHDLKRNTHSVSAYSVRSNSTMGKQIMFCILGLNVISHCG